ncbi:MAG: hypothetical protein M0Z28_10920 [Rhodospirillales bacterium]|nr:hypothetical protein [Rhodospirillales bacterium]
MATPAEQSAERAQEAFDALAKAETFQEARVAWEDFLTHWRRALNRCDAEGARVLRGTYVASKTRVVRDQALAYLWAARNAEEHGLGEIAAVQERAFALAAFGGYEAEVRPPSPRGEQVIRFTPLSDDPPPLFAVLPEHIKLVAIVDRTGVVAVPKGYDYDLRETPAPVALAAFGLDFLRQEISNLAAVQ